jgi:acyl carrier protein
MPTDVTAQEVLEVVTDALVNLGSERDEITSTTTFEALDIDSLDLAELAQIVEERFGVKLDSGDVMQIRTIGDLVTLIEKRV